jgi:hypothetical protein
MLWDNQGLKAIFYMSKSKCYQWAAASLLNSIAPHRLRADVVDDGKSRAADRLRHADRDGANPGGTGMRVADNVRRSVKAMDLSWLV